MYRIDYIKDGTRFPIYDPRLDDYNDVGRPRVHLAVGEPGSMSLTLGQAHPTTVQKMHGYIELQEDGVVLYRGRVVQTVRDFYKDMAVETEGLLACLNDSIVQPFSFPADWLDDPDYQEAAEDGNVVAFFLGWLIDQHNAQTTTEQHIKLGQVTVTDPNNYLARSASDYATTWATIQDKLPAGHILARYEADGVYLDYFAELPLTNTQTVEFGENLLDLEDDLNATDICSAVLPIGADGLTLAELPDGAITADITKMGRLVWSASKRAAYGNITKVLKWDDVTDAANLRRKAAEALAADGIAQTITVAACDLHYAGEGVASFRVGRNVRINSAPHGFAAIYPLISLDIDILDPGNTELTLGVAQTTQTDYNKAQTAETAAKIEGQQLQIDKAEQAVEQVQDAMDGITATTSEQITEAIQSSQAIIFRALDRYVQTGDLETYKQQVSTELKHTADQLELSFRTATELIESINGDLQAKYNERLKYIRFVDGDIILGEDGNEITLTIENDRMTFKQNGLEVAYFSNNKFYVTEAEFSVAARIGAFAFVPGANGNLSFRKVGD